MYIDYYPYGQTKTVSGEGTNYQFAGKELDNESDLHYFGARYYDSSIGRWLICDPANEFFSPYVYCGNNTLKYFDPNGNYRLTAELKSNQSFMQTMLILDKFVNSTPSVKNTFLKLNTKISDFITPGEGPLIESANLYVLGFYSTHRQTDLQTIQIADRIIEKLSNAKNQKEQAFYMSFLIRAILHETSHWAWLTKYMEYSWKYDEYGNMVLDDEVPDSGHDKDGNCLGWYAERSIFGRAYRTDSYLKYRDPMNDPYWNASGQYNRDPLDVWVEFQINNIDEN